MAFPHQPGFIGNLIVHGDNITNLSADLVGSDYHYMDVAALNAAGGFNRDVFVGGDANVGLREEANVYRPAVEDVTVGLVPSAHYAAYGGRFSSGELARAHRKRVRVPASQAKRQAEDLDRVKRWGSKFPSFLSSLIDTRLISSQGSTGFVASTWR
jgi:hypothetical protein